MRTLGRLLAGVILLSVLPSAGADPSEIDVEDCGSTSLPTQIVGNILRHMQGETPQDNCTWLYEQFPTFEDLAELLEPRHLVANQTLIEDPTGVSVCVENIQQHVGSGSTKPIFCIRDAACSPLSGCPTTGAGPIPLGALPEPLGGPVREVYRILHCVWTVNSVVGAASHAARCILEP